MIPMSQEKKEGGKKKFRQVKTGEKKKEE